MAVSYNTVAFDMDSAVNGALVGVNIQDPNDLSTYCGILKVIKDSPIDAPVYTKDGRTVKSIHQVTIKGSTIWCTDTGVVLSCTPAIPQIGVVNVITVGTQLAVLKATIPTTSGTSQTRTRTPEQGHTANIKISELEPRDQFALHALTVIMNKLEHPEAADDANIIQACYTSYRWANAMMLAAADSRTELEPYVPSTPSENTPKDEVDVNEKTLSSNIERLLYNISANLHNKNVKDKKLLDEGYPVRNFKETTTVNDVQVEEIVPFVTKLDSDSEIKKVAEVTKVANCTDLATLLATNGIKVAAMPSTTNVTINGTPTVNLAQGTSVSVSNIPSSIDVGNFPATQVVSGTVDVGNWPSNNNT